MRSLFPILSTSLLVLAANAGAQEQNLPSTESEPISRVQVMAPPQAFVFYDYEAEWISGAYAMSNGWRLKVDPTSNGIVAQIDKRGPVSLVAMSPDRYVTRDGKVSMEFNRGTDGQDMVMSYVPDDPTAEVVVVTATSATSLAQR